MEQSDNIGTEEICEIISDKVDKVIRYRSRKFERMARNYFGGSLNLEIDSITPFSDAEFPNLGNINVQKKAIDRILDIIADFRSFKGMEFKNKEDVRLAVSEVLSSFVYARLFIIIHYPKVDVMNENGDTTTVEDLYAMVEVQDNRFVSLHAIVSTYEYNKAESGYAFSHIGSVSLRNSLPSFSQCCLGTGPLTKLKWIYTTDLDYDKKIDYIIGLVCVNIDRYFHVESLSGGPYIRISNISGGSNGNFLVSVPAQMHTQECDFVLSSEFSYIVKDALIKMANDNIMFVSIENDSINPTEDGMYRNGVRSTACVLKKAYEFCITFSEYFKRSYLEMSLLYELPSTDELVELKVLSRYYESENGMLYVKNRGTGRNGSIMANNGKKLFRFLGRDVNLLIKEDNSEKKEFEYKLFVDINLSVWIEKLYRDILASGNCELSQTKTLIA